MTGHSLSDRNSALYFPYIHIRDANWLKWSILLWDRIYRISPHNYPRKAQYDYIYKLEDAGELVSVIHPEGYAHQIEDEFIKFVEDNYELLEDFRVNGRGSYGDVYNGHRSRFTEHRLRERQLEREFSGPRNGGPGLEFIYSEKMGHRLLDLLLRTGLGVLAEDDSHSWITWVGVHPKIASLYMIVLSNQIALSNRLNTVTDIGPYLASIGEDIGSTAKYVLSKQENVDTRISRSTIYTTSIMLTLQTFVPRDLQNLPLERIIEFRKNHEAEIASFQTYIRDKVSKFEAAGKDGIVPDALADWFQDEVGRDLRIKLNEIERVYRT